MYGKNTKQCCCETMKIFRITKGKQPVDNQTSCAHESLYVYCETSKINGFYTYLRVRIQLRVRKRNELDY